MQRSEIITFLDFYLAYLLIVAEFINSTTSSPLLENEIISLPKTKTHFLVPQQVEYER